MEGNYFTRYYAMALDLSVACTSSGKARVLAGLCVTALDYIDRSRCRYMHTVHACGYNICTVTFIDRHTDYIPSLHIIIKESSREQLILNSISNSKQPNSHSNLM